jgi:lipid-A-disaccharide synthase
MRLFLSAGEPSGDLHGGNLVRALAQAFPGVECAGFGGENMAASGCRLLCPLAQHAFIGFFRVVSSVPFHLRLLHQADEYFRVYRPKAVVLIDYPGFHWWLARVARDRRIPVYFFVPPQLWAWGQWRVHKMRRVVDHVLCALPFEETFFRRHHIPAHYVGHPYFDELPRQQLDGSFLAAQRSRPGPVIALLPGSRNAELRLNVPALLKAAEVIHRRRPHVRFLVACLKSAQEREVKAQTRGLNLPIEVHSGRTAEIIDLAHSCIAVSGSVGLEMLYRHKPAVVIYRHHAFHLFVASFLRKCRYFSLVNLLAGREIYPEILSSDYREEEVAGHVLRWLDDRLAYARVTAQLKELCDRVAQPGACDRAAQAIGQMLGYDVQSRQPLAA